MANTNAHGLIDLIDLGLLNPNDPVRLVDSELLTSGIIYDVATHNADINAMLNLFATTTTERTEGVTQSGSTRNQPLDEKGRSIPTKPMAPYTVAYPLIASGNAWGATWAARQKMTVRNLAQTMATLYRGDFNWVVDHVLAALFLADGYTHIDPVNQASLNIEGLANGDATVYYRTTTGATATDTHLLGQAAGIADATNPFPTIKDELLEHPDNGGEVIVFIPTASVATATALAEFNSGTIDSDLTLGANTDRLTGSLNATLPPGSVVKGKTDSGVWVVEWPRLLTGYVIGVTTEGARPLARRIDPDFGDGFLVRGLREDYPLEETQLSRWEGYGAKNRVGAVSMEIGDASFDTPTGYESPMP